MTGSMQALTHQMLGVRPIAFMPSSATGPNLSNHPGRILVTPKKGLEPKGVPGGARGESGHRRLLTDRSTVAREKGKSIFSL